MGVPLAHGVESAPLLFAIHPHGEYCGDLPLRLIRQGNLELKLHFWCGRHSDGEFRERYAAQDTAEGRMHDDGRVAWAIPHKHRTGSDNSSIDERKVPKAAIKRALPGPGDSPVKL